MTIGNDADEGTHDVEVKLGREIGIHGRYMNPSKKKLDAVADDLFDERSREKIRKQLGPHAPRTIEALLRSHRATREANTLRYSFEARVSDLLADLGGVSVELPKNAAQFGGGLDSAAIGSARDIPVARRALDSFSAGPGVSLAFEAATNPLNQNLKRWLESEGSFAQFVGWAAQHFPRAVPVVVAECGQPNAFYHPRTRSITLCYELAGDLAKKLATVYKTNKELGGAVLGAFIFVLIHEYGHALIHQLDLPATGREEDAVDQLAALSLIRLGNDGILKAITAMRWFAISEQLGQRTPFFDEHSANAVRAYDITCLIYGSNPEGLKFIAGSNWLPTSRAVRCPSEFHKANKAWGRLLGEARTSAPTAHEQPRSMEPTGAPAEVTVARGACAAIQGRWDFETQVTKANNATALGTTGYYRLEVSEDCGARVEKTGFGKTRFTPDRIQTGRGRLVAADGKWTLSTDISRGATVDYSVMFGFEVASEGLRGVWSYTGQSLQTTGFQGSLSGSRR